MVVEEVAEAFTPDFEAQDSTRETTRRRRRSRTDLANRGSGEIRTFFMESASKG
jgi:hypothetical protein